MKKSIRSVLFVVFAVVFLLFFTGGIFAQSSPTTPAAGFDMTGSPQWAKDLRRGEIVAFGSFPFTFFFSSFFMDTYRYVSNNQDIRYAPWPFKPAGAVDMTYDQQMLTIGIAASGAIVIALVDHLILKYNRDRETQKQLSMPPGTPIIIRRPMNDGDTGDAGVP
ncbi:MAG: hypothetical protein FWF22_06025, partial [Treponema sp.]|nr:hypothetical protein [Treponema sp.]